MSDVGFWPLEIAQNQPFKIHSQKKVHMKNCYFLLLLLCSTLKTLAQTPSNDDCAGITDLGKAPACPMAIFSNKNSTASNIGLGSQPSCAPSLVIRDVWFKFTCPTDILDFRISATGAGTGTISQPQLAVYRGDCSFDGLAQIACTNLVAGSFSATTDLVGLSPNEDYFIRVWDNAPAANPKWGDFQICVDKIPPVIKINEADTNLPFGSLADSGGKDGNYGKNDNHSLTICPPAPAGCITFTLDYYHFDYVGGGFLQGNGNDFLAFYDGKTTDPTKKIVQINGTNFNDPTIVEGGGGVCFPVQASSGCLTVQFKADGSDEHEGFLGHWTTSPNPCTAPKPIDLDEATEPLILNALSTPFTTISNVEMNCPDGAIATFAVATDNALSMKKGLILTSGEAFNVLGPNNNDSAGTDNFAPGDDDLDYLSSLTTGQESLDACILEMDLFAATDQISFEYVFGSEEYPEYVNDNYNDIFAFLISGQGLVGDPNLENSAINIATIPNVGVPVEINSVNQTLNWEFFRNNQTSQFLQYDGLTSDKLGVKKTLTARTSVTPCKTYHLKLAVADRFDGIYDSGVFISEISGGLPEVAVNFASGINYFVEKCSGNQDKLVIKISNPIEKDVTLQVSIAGTATLGTDYLLNIPGVVTIPAGQTSVEFSLVPLDDAIPEGTETIVVTLSNNFGCGSVTYKTFTVEIQDDPIVDAGPDVTICKNVPFQLHATGADTYFWQPPNVVDSAFIANPTLTTSQNVLLIVTGTVGACTDLDSVFVTVVDPTIEVSALDSTKICLGESVPLLAVGGILGLPGLEWSPAAGLSNVFDANPVATPTTTTTYFATISTANCTVSDSITIFVDTLFFPNLAATTTICQKNPVKLADDLTSSTIYSWTPTTDLDNPNIAGATANANLSTTYTLTATSANGNCSQTGSVTVNITPADVRILDEKYREICLGQSETLTAESAPPGAVITWSPPFTLTQATGNQVIATPDETTTYYARYEINGCVALDSVKIRVDSLPIGTLKLQPVKAIYCPGDTVFMISPTYEPANFPDINILWEQFGTMLTPDSFWNMVILASQTHVYYREITNHACSRQDSIEVPVGIIPEFTITATPPGFCPGGSSVLHVEVNPTTVKWEWEENAALPCTDCNDPKVSPGQTTFFSVKTIDEPCPASGGIEVEVFSLPTFNLQDHVICPGASVLLNNVQQSQTAYSWTTIPPSAFTSGQANPTVTPTATTTYHVEAITEKGCTGARDVKVTISQGTINAGADQNICEGENVTLNATAIGDTPIVTWPTTPNPNNNPNTFPVTGTAEYEVILTFGQGCTISDKVLVTALPLPDLNLAKDTSICLGRSVKLNNVLASGATYSWNSTPPATPAVSGANPTVTPNVTTDYRVTATNPANLGGCATVGLVRVEVANATLNAGLDQTVCDSSIVVLTATQAGTPGTISWTNAPDPNNPSSFPATATANYFARLDYGPGCVDRDTVRVTVLATPKIDNVVITPDSLESKICEGTPIALKVFTTPSAATGTTFTWFQKLPNEDFKELPDEKTATLLLKPGIREGIATYKVVVTNNNNCSDESEEIGFEFRKCLEVPNAFTPNGDGNNDDFGIVQFEDGSTFEIQEFIIFSRWGEKVFKGDKTHPRWDGKIGTKDAPSDTYYYLLTVKLADGQVISLHGKDADGKRRGEVTLLR